MIIDPRGFDSILPWADLMAGALGYFSDETVGSDANFPILQDPSKWQEWAEGVFCCGSGLGQDVPDPYAYDNWREWADRMFATTNFTG